MKPGEAARDHPPLLAKTRAVSAPPTGDDRLDASLSQLAAVFVVVIAAVGEQTVGSLARGADPAGYRAIGSLPQHVLFLLVLSRSVSDVHRRARIPRRQKDAKGG